MTNFAFVLLLSSILEVMNYVTTEKRIHLNSNYSVLKVNSNFKLFNKEEQKSGIPFMTRQNWTLNNKMPKKIEIMGTLEKMFKWIIMLFISIVSTSLMMTIYFIKSSYWLIPVGEKEMVYINVLIYIAFPFVLSYIILLLLKRICPKDSIKNAVKGIKPIDNDYIPVYLGYIFVSLSIPNPSAGIIDMWTFMVVYSIINFVIVSSSTVCFNPIFIIFGYTYYAVKTQGNVTVFIMSKRKIGKNESIVSFCQLKKITETVFIEV